jgi:hypothetical protein
VGTGVWLNATLRYQNWEMQNLKLCAFASLHLCAKQNSYRHYPIPIRKIAKHNSHFSAPRIETVGKNGYKNQLICKLNTTIRGSI